MRLSTSSFFIFQIWFEVSEIFETKIWSVAISHSNNWRLTAKIRLASQTSNSISVQQILNQIQKVNQMGRVLLVKKKQGLQTSCHRPFNIKARELSYTVCTYVSRGGVPSVPCLVLHVPAHDALLIHAGHHGELPGMAMLTACTGAAKFSWNLISYFHGTPSAISLVGKHFFSREDHQFKGVWGIARYIEQARWKLDDMADLWTASRHRRVLWLSTKGGHSVRYVRDEQDQT
jgi:hypothetical protein